MHVYCFVAEITSAQDELIATTIKVRTDACRSIIGLFKLSTQTDFVTTKSVS